MKYRRLGNTGLFVSELCLGTMTFGELAPNAVAYGTSSTTSAALWRAIGQVGQGDVDRQFRTAIDAGINFIDTADIYSSGLSEESVGGAIRNLGLARESLVVATKAFGATGPGPNDRGASRGHLMNAVKASLRRLGTDYIDLYQIHGFDTVTPIEETLRALDDLVTGGHVRYIGCSNWAAWQVAKALGVSGRLGLARFETVQAHYSVAGRDLEHEIIPMASSETIGLMIWSPLAGGLLSGKQARGTAEAGTRRAQMAFPPVDPRVDDVIAAMEEIALAHGASVAQIALAWLLHRPGVTSVIIGAKRQAQLEDNLKAADIALDTDQMARLTAAAEPALLYPRWMMARQDTGRRPAPFVAAKSGN